MRQYNRRRIFNKASFYLVILAVLGFTFGSFVFTKRAIGEANILAPILSATKIAAHDTTAGACCSRNGVIMPNNSFNRSAD